MNTPDTCTCPQHGDWMASGGVKRLVRQLDVALNGEAGAAPQAALIDVVGQVLKAARDRGAPLLAHTAIEAGGCAPPVYAEGCACTCPSGDGSLRWPCPKHPPTAPTGFLRESLALLPPDEFKNDDSHLIVCIEALLSLDKIGNLRPHGVGGQARGLLAAAAHRLARWIFWPEAAPQPPAEAQAVAAQAEQSDRRTFPMGYDSHLHGLVTDNVASALLCCGIEHLPAGVLDTIASEIVRGYHAAPQPPSGGECHVPWIEEWQGSGPQRGYHIREATHLHNNRVVAYLGDQVSGDEVDKLIAEHNGKHPNGEPVRIPTAKAWCDENAVATTGEWQAGWDACRVEFPRTAPPSAPVASEHVRRLVGHLAQWVLCMSHNESYFGEAAGHLKSTVEELVRSVDPIYPPKLSPSDSLAGVEIHTATVPFMPAQLPTTTAPPPSAPVEVDLSKLKRHVWSSRGWEPDPKGPLVQFKDLEALAQQPAAKPFVGVVCPECNAEYEASAQQPAAAQQGGHHE